MLCWMWALISGGARRASDSCPSPGPRPRSAAFRRPKRRRRFDEGPATAAAGNRYLIAPRPSLRSLRVGGLEKGNLVGPGLLEGGALGRTGHVGVGRRTITESADRRNPQHIRHQQVGDSEAAGRQPLSRAQYGFELAEALAHPSRKLVVLVAGDLQEPPGYGDHLDRVERGDRPLERLRLSRRIAGHQLVVFARQMQQPRAAFEYLH